MTPETPPPAAPDAPRDPLWLAKLLFRHGLGGMAAGWIMVAAAVGSDVAGLRGLIFASNIGWLALVLLMVFVGLTCASLAMGSAIMALGRAPTDRGGPRGRVAKGGRLTPLANARRAQLSPVPVRSGQGARRRG